MKLKAKAKRGQAPPVSTKGARPLLRWLRPQNDERGVTMIELLCVVIISAIALVGAAMPFYAEQAFWRTGRERTGSQRDAQFVMRTIARTAREGTGYTIDLATNSVTFHLSGCDQDFQRVGSRFQMVDHCTLPAETRVLIDGGASDVTQFTVTQVVANRLVDIQLEILQGNQEREQLHTQIFLRNA